MGRTLPLIGEFWQRVLAKVEARHAPGRLKQWLGLLRRNFPQAEILYAECAMKDDAGGESRSWRSWSTRAEGRRVKSAMYANSSSRERPAGRS
jgi:hypothetical protein